ADATVHEITVDRRRLPGVLARNTRRAVDLHPDSLDGVRFDLLADARLLADPLRGGARRKLLPDFRPPACHPGLSDCLAALSGKHRRDFLLASAAPGIAGH